MKKSLNRPMENLIRGLDEHTEYLSDEEVREELTAYGVDIDTILKRANALISYSLREERTAWMKEADINCSAINAASKKIISWIGRGEDEILAAFEKLTGGLSQQQALAFRNRKDLSVAEKAQILDDFQKVQQPPEFPQA